MVRAKSEASVIIFGTSVRTTYWLRMWSFMRIDMAIHSKNQQDWLDIYGFRMFFVLPWQPFWTFSKFYFATTFWGSTHVYLPNFGPIRPETATELGDNVTNLTAFIVWLQPSKQMSTVCTPNVFEGCSYVYRAVVQLLQIKWLSP